MCKGWRAADWARQKRPLLLLSTKRNWEQWQLKSNASVYSRCLEPLFTLPTLITHIIRTGVLPVAHQCGAGLRDSLAGFSLKAAAENEPCHLSEFSSNSNGACAFSPLNLQPSAWTWRRLNSIYRENIMSSVIVPLVLQGLFAVLIKQADWWLGIKPGCVGILCVCDTDHFGMCMCVRGGRQPGRLRRSTEARALLVFPHMPQIQWPSPA